jgi:DNA polymerase III delta subunit
MEGNLFSTAKRLCIVSDPDKLDVDVVRKHRESKSKDLCLLLVFEKDFTLKSAMGKLCEGADIPKRHRLTYKAPAKYKANEFAADFVKEEAKAMGYSIGMPLAESLVTKVGTDYGVLHFELVKVAAYVRSRGEIKPEILPKHLKATMSLTGEAAVQPLVDAVSVASVKNTLRALDNLWANSKSDPTLLVCAWLGNQAVKWLHTSALMTNGADKAEAASRVGVHPYVFDRFVLPVARRWTGPHLKILIKNLSTVERAVRSGHVSPWVELQAGLVRSCRTVRPAG